MSQHNPELKPKPVALPDLSIRADAPDFIEQPDVPPGVTPERRSYPIWLYLICGFALFLAGGSFSGFGHFGSGYYDQGPGAPELAPREVNSEPAVVDPMALGKKVYNGNCANCHQANGEGQPGAYPPMVGSEWVLGDKERLSAIMLNGVSGPLTVKGGAYGSNVMPAWATTLTDKNIADVLTYVRQTWGNKADEVKPEEVASARTKFAAHTNPWQETELMKMAPAAGAPAK